MRRSRSAQDRLGDERHLDRPAGGAGGDLPPAHLQRSARSPLCHRARHRQRRRLRGLFVDGPHPLAGSHRQMGADPRQARDPGLSGRKDPLQRHPHPHRTQPVPEGQGHQGVPPVHHETGGQVGRRSVEEPQTGKDRLRLRSGRDGLQPAHRLFHAAERLARRLARGIREAPRQDRHPRLQPRRGRRRSLRQLPLHLRHGRQAHGSHHQRRLHRAGLDQGRAPFERHLERHAQAHGGAPPRRLHIAAGRRRG